MDEYDLARELVDTGRVVTCIPVINYSLEEDVAVVGLRPNGSTLGLVISPDPDARARALVLIAIEAHSVLSDCGLTYANDLSN